MAKVKKTMQLIEKSIKAIDGNYDMGVRNIDDIQNASANPYELICNGFRFGYMQGMKAAKAETKRRGSVNG